ncbi:Cyclin-D4-1 [Sesamum alatum]|uniref:Cyclin-D4-1 n=1 Tax=Sesamum alatum TaxID=300844 RepID=A0AAE1XSD0_9LAMI|nr:Cyclin-D4-1 [Sesamum alatum]
MVDNNSFDCAATDLFCNEGSKGLCFDDDDGGDGDSFEPFNGQSHHQSNGENEVIFSNGGPDSEALMMYLPCLSEECICWMVEREREHLPRDDYLSRLRSGELDLSLRRMALDWMIKACAHYNFGELSLCSAMSYVDRFLSVYELPTDSQQRGDKKWAIQLVAVACLSMAAKIEEVNVPSTVDLQAGETKFLFDGKTIQRMEIVVLNRLDWKIKAYTPCNFVDYYLRKTNDDEFPSGPLITRSLQVILSTLEGIEFLEFRPSEIAAAVAIYVSGQIQATDIDNAVSRCVGVEKERVVKCIELIQELKSTSGISTTSTTTASNVDNSSVSSASEPQSPNGVLEAACFSYKSDEGTVESCSSSSHTSPDTKRRKLDQTATVGGES